MELFPRQEIQETKADKEFATAFKTFSHIVQFICVGPFRMFGLLISIVYAGLFRDRTKKKENMTDLEKLRAAEEFQSFSKELVSYDEKSLTEAEIIQKARKRYE